MLGSIEHLIPKQPQAHRSNFINNLFSIFSTISTLATVFLKATDWPHRPAVIVVLDMFLPAVYRVNKKDLSFVA
jgi:hypothetical protein